MVNSEWSIVNRELIWRFNFFASLREKKHLRHAKTHKD